MKSQWLQRSRGPRLASSQGSAPVQIYGLVGAEAAAQELDQIHTDLANGMSMMELESSKRGRAVAAAAFHLRSKADVAEESLAKKLKVAEPEAESRLESTAATDGEVEACGAGTARGGSAGPSTHGEERAINTANIITCMTTRACQAGYTRSALWRKHCSE